MAEDIELLREIADRARRTETRVTKIANHFNVEAGGDKPVFHAQTGEIDVPSRRVSLEDVLNAVPHGHTGRVDVCCGRDFLVTLFV